MKRLPWGLVSWSAAFLAGCGEQRASMPIPPMDATAPTSTETATFALG